MALGDSYATVPELKARLDITDTTDDARLTEALAGASREIEVHCDRQFNEDIVAASPRVYRPLTGRKVLVDDIHTVVGLIVATDDDDDGVYETTWTAADYQLEPLNGTVSGQSGWPYSRIAAVSSRIFPACSRRPAVQVTAQWGWQTVPTPVKEACLIIAAELFKLGDAPFGVAGFGEFGPVRVRMNSRAQSLLAPYRRNPVLVA